MSIQNPVPKLYKSIVDDVIHSCRDIFLDDGIDEQILHELRQLWETKLSHSKAVDNMLLEPEHVISTQIAIQQQQAQQHAAKIAAAAFLLQNNALYQQSYINQNFHPINNDISSSAAAAAFAIPSQLYQHFHNVIGNSSALFKNQSSTTNTKKTIAPSTVSISDGNSKTTHIVQIDGKYDDNEEDEFDELEPSGEVGLYKKFKKAGRPLKRQTLEKQQPKHKKIVRDMKSKKIQFGLKVEHDNEEDYNSQEDVEVQVDEDENLDIDEDLHNDDQEEEELDDEILQPSPMNASRHPSSSVASHSEEPLNSEDDVSEEDPTNLFDTENVIVCQFEKITRSRNKWKFYFKDGIMNVNGKDYVFQRALGEAEW
ncbi:unnamed protein product [Gordionus sp. m RMFG-2023]|uniref:TFIIA-alpha and beta-like factor isoform X1 n=1 Tax=Gordionus sp. m RMFG-2023 TaxID=3053472 RepID=UPI0030E375FD